jgi:hypothetical protein
MSSTGDRAQFDTLTFWDRVARKELDRSPAFTPAG